MSDPSLGLNLIALTFSQFCNVAFGLWRLKSFSLGITISCQESEAVTAFVDSFRLPTTDWQIKRVNPGRKGRSL
jgi:hypothetical protein